MGTLTGKLSFAEFCKAAELVKPNVATGRDNIPGTILRLLPVEILVLLYIAVVERLAGREDFHVKDWAEFDECLVPKKGDISCLDRWRPISFFPTLFKLYEICMCKVLDKELRPLPAELFGFRPGRQCLDIVSFLVEGLRKAEEWGEKLFVSEEHVDAVGAWSRCSRCDGWGYFARGCPSKGKGKWDFGKGGGKATVLQGRLQGRRQEQPVQGRW